MPLELNSREIMHRNNIGSQMIVYGYYPLMTTANCVHKNTKGCDKKQKLIYLKDRYNKSFAVCNNCKECYNTIYNSLPTMLTKNISKLKEAVSEVLDTALQSRLQSRLRRLWMIR